MDNGFDAVFLAGTFTVSTFAFKKALSNISQISVFDQSICFKDQQSRKAQASITLNDVGKITSLRL